MAVAVTTKTAWKLREWRAGEPPRLGAGRGGSRLIPALGMVSRPSLYIADWNF